MSSKVTEGRIPFTVGNETFETYYKVFGDISNASTQPPLVVLHGGPGLSHDYMTPVGDLAFKSPSTAVIMYDQLGSGHSTHLHSKPIDFWTIDLFIAELENLLSHFSISDSYNLLGHSWGATLAAEFVVRRQPVGLQRLVLANCLASAKLRNVAVKLRRSQLPEDVQEVLRMHEADGTTSSPRYRAAMMVYYANFGCRVQPFPEDIAFSLKQPELDDTVLKAMRRGLTGLEDRWDIIDRIHLINKLTLLINGEYDFMTDEVCAPYFNQIDKCKWVRFSHSSHMPHWEERERYMVEVGGFLSHA